MALSAVRPTWTPPPRGNLDMSWEELTRLSDRELLLLLHQRLEQLDQKVEGLEEKVEKRWDTTWRVLAWAIGALFSVVALFIAGHAAKIW